MLRLLLLLLMSQMTSSQNYKIKYLEKLILKNIEKASKYVLPTNASEFKIKDNDYGTFDFIIIGAGVGGSVLANRLSEIEDFSVLLLEAGSWENEFVNIPGMFPYARGSEYNWNFRTIPQQYGCLGFEGRQCVCARGKGFGGGSIFTTSIYSRGNKADFNIWEENGNTGWSYKKILKYFMKSEKVTFPDYDKGYHGFAGPLTVQYQSPVAIHTKAFLEASKELGYEELDYNGKSQIGVSRAQFTSENGQRLSHGKAFLRPILERQNLNISDRSYVTKILIDKESKNATGVLFTKNGKTYIAKASKEVIGCAGSFMTPQILMLSGIGPKEDLEKFQIETIVDLPVGRQLVDNPGFFGLNIFSNISITAKNLTERLLELLNGEGSLTTAASLQAVAFLQSKYAEIEGQPDLEYLFCSPNRTNPFYQKVNGFTDLAIQSLLKNVSDQTSTFTAVIMCLRPKSLGSVKLRSTDPFDYPIIDTNTLSHPRDVDIILDGIRLMQRMMKTKAFKSIAASVDLVDHPDCKSYTPDCDEYWHCLIRIYTTSLHTAMGTTKMAPKGKGGVVDPTLKVYGIKNLRISDAGVIPPPLSSSPISALTMIAEKLSDMMKIEYGFPIH